jgi:hypothetical protein
MWQITNLPCDTEPLKHAPAGWIQTIAAHFFSWKSCPLEDKRLQTSHGAKCCAARSGRPGPDNSDIKHFHRTLTGDQYSVRRSLITDDIYHSDVYFA